jgi:hypothetical protein
MSPQFHVDAEIIIISIDPIATTILSLSFHLLNEININTYFKPISSATIDDTSIAASFGKYAVSLIPEITRVIS